ncbi:MAG: winged helix-turn-helix domain-containing protein [Terriglobales bacterium]
MPVALGDGSMDSADNTIYEFRGFRLEPRARRLFRGGIEVPLAPKHFDTLLLLVQHPNEVITKREFLDKIWPGTFVGDATLAQKISQLRKALNEGGHAPPCIQTASKVGYRFAAEVKRIQGPIATDNTVGAGGDAFARSAASVPPNPGGFAPVSAASAAFGGYRRWWAAAAASLAAALGLTAGVSLYGRRARDAIGQYRVTDLEVANPAKFGVLSTDGKLLAYVAHIGGADSLWVRPVAAAGNGAAVVPDLDGACYGVTFSPDDQYLYFVTHAGTYGLSQLSRVGVLGGVPQTLLPGVSAAVAFEPGGKRIIFRRYTDPAHGAGADLVMAQADGSEARTLAHSDVPYPYYSYYWSAPGRIVYEEGVLRSTRVEWSVYETAVGGGAPPRLILGPQPHAIKSLQPLNPGLILAVATSPESSRDQVWAHDPRGNFRPVTNDTSEYSGVSAAADSPRFLAMRDELRSSLWIAALPAGKPDGPIAAGLRSQRKVNLPDADYDDPSWTPSGDLVYLAPAGVGHRDLWWASAAGARQRRLTSGSNIQEPAVSPAGGFVAFINVQDGYRSLERINLDGTGRQRLLGGLNYSPSISSDGRWILFNAMRDGKWGVWRLPSSGGAAAKVANSAETDPLFSPDSKLAAFEFVRAGGTTGWGVFSVADGSRLQTLALPAGAVVRGWGPDGRSLLYLVAERDTNTLWRQHLAGGGAEKLADLGDDPSPQVRSSFDGRHIIYVRRNWRPDLLLFDRLP